MDGVIYSAPKVKAFRVLVAHNDKHTEKGLDGVVPSQSRELEKSTAAINEGRKNKQ